MSALTKYRTKAASPAQLTIVNKADTVDVAGIQFTAQQVKALEGAGVDIVGRGRKAMEARPKGLGGPYATAYKNDPASTTLTGPALQGPFQGNINQWGLFTAPGTRPERFSAMARPLSISRLLIDQGSLQRSEFMNELIEIMTGVTAGAGTNATGFCGNPPTAGQMKVMRRIFQFGQWYMKTNLNAVPLIGRLLNRADVPGRILNAGPEANPLIPDIMYQLNDTRSQLQTEMFNLGVETERTLEQVLVVGDHTLASGSTHLGWISEFTGLDSQITTGLRDDLTNQPAPAADSIAVNWGNVLVSGNQVSTGDNIVQSIASTYWALMQRAAKVGMDGFEMAIVMRLEFFRALTDIYACSYATARCTNGAVGTPQVVDQTIINNLRLEMLQGQYLLIEGVKVPVVFTDGIPLRPVGANQYVATFYFVPVSWAGRPLVTIQYFDMNNPYAQEYANFVNSEKYRVLNNGLYLVGYRSAGLCDEYLFASSLRLILETPFLAARYDSINYTYNASSFSPYPSESSLYRDGGVTYRAPYYAGYA